MKQIFVRTHIGIVFSALFFYGLSLNAQQTCCSLVPKPVNLQSVASEKAFIASHITPRPFTAPAPEGLQITFATPDGKTANVFVTNVKENPEHIVLLFHEWWGLNDYIKAEAARIADELDVMVVALDMYDGKIASTREEASGYMKSLTEERGLAIVAGAYEHFPKAKFVPMGWCLGGGWALKTALHPPVDSKRIVGCVMYYGSTETDQAKLAKLACPVIGIFGKKDKWLNPQVVDDFKKAMETAGKSITIYSYDADHAFANPSNPNYDRSATEDAMDHTMTFIKNSFGLR